MEEKIEQIRSKYLAKINEASDLITLDELFLALFGKNGAITLLPKEFSSVEKDQLRTIGPLFNSLKQDLEKAIENKRLQVKEKSYEKLDTENYDLNTEIAALDTTGHLHPLTQFEKQIVDTFSKLGFQQFEAPYIDTDYNNFEVLNIPEEHPARDLWDTLYIDAKKYGYDERKLLLRTHTSNSQIHIMKNLSLPIRAMTIGSCFRYENVDARHEHTFDQFELVYIDKGLSMANLQYLSEEFFKALFSEDIKVRLRPKYYPFVEPTAGIDALCIFCKGKGCKVCGEGWLELAGAGMIHPNVLKNGGIDPEVYSGIAWGVGPERMLMLKYGIDDIRLLRSGDLRFLEKF